MFLKNCILEVSSSNCTLLIAYNHCRLPLRHDSVPRPLRGLKMNSSHSNRLLLTLKSLLLNFFEYYMMLVQKYRAQKH